MKKPASEEFYRNVWEREIELGIIKGRLTNRNGLADLKTGPSTPEDHAELKEKYGK